jgi:predicted metal-dependent TIM-barrel fold hydrolase
MDDFERLITAEAQRCASVGIEHLTLVGVPAADAVHAQAAHQAIDMLPEYLKRQGVVGIGEIGYENFTEEETHILRRQLQVARQAGVPVVIQAPTKRKAHAVGLSLQLCEEAGIERKHILVKGLDEETLPMVKRYGAWAGLTIHPAFIGNDRLVSLIGRYGTDGLLLQSDAGRGYGEPLAVPSALQRLAEEGLPQAELAKLGYHNPKWFYSQGLAHSQQRAREMAGTRR